MPIVKCTNKHGRTYAYLSVSHYDPEKKASRPVKQYLGRVDPVTGEIIPPKAKRSSVKKQEAGAPEENECDTLRAKLLQATLQNQQYEDKIRSQQQEITRLQTKNSKLQKKLDMIHRESTPEE